MSGMLSSEQGLRVRESTTSNQTVGAESSSPLLNPSGSSGPSLQRDVSSVGGAGRVLSGQRPRHQQKKHPEPLRRAVADCLSCSPHASASVFPTEAVRTVQVMSWPLTVLFAALQDSTTSQCSYAVLNLFCISVAEALWQSLMFISSVLTPSKCIVLCGILCGICCGKFAMYFSEGSVPDVFCFKVQGLGSDIWGSDLLRVWKRSLKIFSGLCITAHFMWTSER